jgi:serine/threonine protein kinase
MHGLIIRTRGAINEDAVRFLVAEVLSALSHLHEAGFAYADMKPENVMLVHDISNGVHAKLTDFGAARPINTKGRLTLANSRRILADLRDGDWRATHGIAVSNKDTGVSAQGELVDTVSSVSNIRMENPKDEDIDEDSRVEGTEAYLSPELADGTSQPSIASDAFAFGVMLYQLLSGRLPDAELVTRLGKYSPDTQSDSTIESMHIPSQSVRFVVSTRELFPPSFPLLARDLVSKLLHPNPSERLGGGERGVSEILEHPWFNSLFTSVTSKIGECSTPLEIAGKLYKMKGPIGLPLADNNALNGSTPDAAWSRRQNSTLWAPLPKSYMQMTSTPTMSSNISDSEPKSLFLFSELLAITSASLPLPPLYIPL